jgi:hypothetical protein
MSCFRPRNFEENLAGSLRKASIVTPPEKQKMGLANDTWLVLNVLDQTRFTVVR